VDDENIKRRVMLCCLTSQFIRHYDKLKSENKSLKKLYSKSVHIWELANELGQKPDERVMSVFKVAIKSQRNTREKINSKAENDKSKDLAQKNNRMFNFIIRNYFEQEDAWKLDKKNKFKASWSKAFAAYQADLKKQGVEPPSLEAIKKQFDRLYKNYAEELWQISDFAFEPSLSIVKKYGPLSLKNK